MSLLEQCTRQRARRNRIVFLSVAFICAGFALVAAVGPIHPEPSFSQRLVPFGIMLAGLVLFGRMALRAPAQAELGLRVLAQRPGDIVWAYVWQSPYETQIVLGLFDGSREVVEVPPARADELLRETAARLPHAAIGYCPSANATFVRDPRALRRRPG
jgi:hypothetical protein